MYFFKSAPNKFFYKIKCILEFNFGIATNDAGLEYTNFDDQNVSKRSISRTSVDGFFLLRFC